MREPKSRSHGWKISAFDLISFKLKQLYIVINYYTNTVINKIPMPDRHTPRYWPNGTLISEVACTGHYFGKKPAVGTDSCGLYTRNLLYTDAPITAFECHNLKNANHAVSWCPLLFHVLSIPPCVSPSTVPLLSLSNISATISASVVPSVDVAAALKFCNERLTVVAVCSFQWITVFFFNFYQLKYLKRITHLASNFINNFIKTSHKVFSIKKFILMKYSLHKVSR